MTLPHMPALHTPEEDLASYSTVFFAGARLWLVECSAEVARRPVTPKIAPALILSR